MPFYLYRRFQENSKEFLEKQRQIKLAGHNMKCLWRKKGKPINAGWHISLDDIIQENISEGNDARDHTVIIDLDPSSRKIITLLELSDIYAFTYGQNSVVSWTVLMLKLKEIFAHSDKNLTSKKREQIIHKIQNPADNEKSAATEFLYLQGENRGWNWGMVGYVNAALIYEDAKEFFKKYF